MNMEGTKPSEEILAIVDNIGNKIDKINGNLNIDDILLDYLNIFLNNRIGTYLKKTEMELLIKNHDDFKIGDIVAYQIDEEIYIISLIIGMD
jgi:uncharacterized protein YijF (DUF1287 family)